MERKNRFSKAKVSSAHEKHDQFHDDKVTTLNIVMTIMIVVLIGFSTLRFLEGSYIQAFADVFLLGLTLVCYVLLYRNKDYIRIVSRVLIFFALVASLTLIISMPEVDTRFAWMSICIYMMFFLLDLKEGILWFSTTFLIIVGLYLTDVIFLSISEFVIFIVSILLFAFLMSRYEKIKEDSAEQYETQSKRLTKAVEEKTHELTAQKEMFESLFQKSYDGLTLVENGELIECNDAIVSMLGYTKKEELLNAHPSDLSPEYQPDGRLSREKADEMINICFEKGAHQFEWLHQKADGKTFMCDITLTHLKLPDRNLIHAAWRDITEQKKLEEEYRKINENLELEVRKRTNELEVASRAKSDFLANMSHEIRTPLNAMLGFVDVLKKDETDSERQKYFNIVHGSGQALLTIINDILDFSKIDSGSLEIEKVPFDISKPFHEVQMLFFEKAKEKNIAVELVSDLSLPEVGTGDIIRIKQVVSNFMSNAIKFTPENGSIVMHISFNHTDSTLSCSVKDSGVGIANENIDKIFNAFSQEDSSTTRKYGGTGLGLTICKRLVELMGGTIGVNSELGKGSEFYFNIPCEPKEHNDLEMEDIETKKLPTSLKGNVLIVEDNKMNQMFVQIMLTELGLTCDIAENGKEAIEWVENNAYDLILMDENMPVMNGIEATKEIRKLEAGKDIPIIAVTANALKGDKEKFLQAGMDDYVSKPIEYENFVEVLGKYLEH